MISNKKLIVLFMFNVATLTYSYRPIELVTNTLDDHVNMFGIQHERNFVRFLQEELPNYPMPVGPGIVPSNPLERNQWLNGPFNGYAKNIKHKSSKFAQEMKLFNDISTDILVNIGKIVAEEELQKILEYPNLHQIKRRFKQYRELYNSGKAAIDSKFQKNIDIESDPLKGPATLSEYKRRQRDFNQFLQTIVDTPLFNAENVINTIEQKVNLQKQRLKNKPKSTNPMVTVSTTRY